MQLYLSATGENEILISLLKGEEFVMLAKKWMALSKETARWKTKDPKAEFENRQCRQFE